MRRFLPHLIDLVMDRKQPERFSTARARVGTVQLGLFELLTAIAKTISSTFQHGGPSAISCSDGARHRYAPPATLRGRRRS